MNKGSIRFSGLIKFMNSNYNGPINLGNPYEEFIIKDLANLVIEKINPSLEIEYKSLPDDDPRMRRPNIHFAKSFLKWEPQVNFKQGLEYTIDYFKKKLLIK